MPGLLVTAILLAALMASPARAATLVYVGNAESNEIHVLQLDRQSGDLTVIEKVAIPGITKPGISTPMAVSPDRRFLYAGTSSTWPAARSPTAWRTSPPIVPANSCSALRILATSSP